MEPQELLSQTEIIAEEEATPGTRRSGRRRFKPLEFWKSERLVYTQAEGIAGLEA